MPLKTLFQPASCSTPSEVTHVIFSSVKTLPPFAETYEKKCEALSKSETTAIRMLIATITNGKARNHLALPREPHLYLMTMKPMQPVRAA